MTIKGEIKKVRDNVYEIPGSYDKKMRASGRFYIDDESFENLEEGAVKQIVNVACLPGVQKYSIGACMIYNCPTIFCMKERRMVFGNHNILHL